jgi:CBS domain-containing protein
MGSKRYFLEGTVEDVMVRQAVCVHEDDTIDDLIALFVRHNYHGFPVLAADERVVGIVRDVELLSLFARREATTPMLHLVRDIMRTPPPVVDAGDPIQKAIIKTYSDNTRFLVVADRERRVIGVVTRIDLIKGIRSSDEAD